MTLLILRGAPGSGKSTRAAEKAAEGWIIVSRDQLREQLLGGVEVFDDEGYITLIQNATIDYRLSQGYNVVVDNTNTKWLYVRQLAAIAERQGVAVEIEVVDVPLDEIKRRNAGRSRVVPEHVINHYYNELQISKDWTL